MNAISQMTPKAASQDDGSSGQSQSPTAPVTENMFLQLLVSQLKNQDPTNPADSTQFVSQLAQFQTMSQSLNQGKDISAIRQDLDSMSALMAAQNKSK